MIKSKTTYVKKRVGRRIANSREFQASSSSSQDNRADLVKDYVQIDHLKERCRRLRQENESVQRLRLGGVSSSAEMLIGSHQASLGAFNSHNIQDSGRYRLVEQIPRIQHTHAPSYLYSSSYAAPQVVHSQAIPATHLVQNASHVHSAPRVVRQEVVQSSPMQVVQTMPSQVIHQSIPHSHNHKHSSKRRARRVSNQRKSVNRSDLYRPSYSPVTRNPNTTEYNIEDLPASKRMTQNYGLSSVFPLTGLPHTQVKIPPMPSSPTLTPPVQASFGQNPMGQMGQMGQSNSQFVPVGSGQFGQSSSGQFGQLGTMGNSMGNFGGSGSLGQFGSPINRNSYSPQGRDGRHKRRQSSDQDAKRKAKRKSKKEKKSSSQSSQGKDKSMLKEIDNLKQLLAAQSQQSQVRGGAMGGQSQSMLLSRMDEYQQAIRALQRQNNKKDGIINSLTRDIQSFNKQYKTLQDRHSVLEQTNSELERQKRNLADQNQRLKRALKQYEYRLQDDRKGSRPRKGEDSERDRELQHLKMMMEQNSRSTPQTDNRQLDALKQMIFDLQKQSYQKAAQAVDPEDSRDNRRFEFDLQRANEESRRKSDQIGRLQSRCRQLQQTLKRVQAEYQKFGRELDKLNKERMLDTVRDREKEITIAALKKQLQNQQKKNLQLIKQLEDRIREIKALEKELNDLRSQLLTSNLTLSLREKALEEAKEAGQKLQANAQRQRGEKKNKDGDLQRKLRELEGELRKKNDQLKRNADKLQSLGDELDRTKEKQRENPRSAERDRLVDNMEQELKALRDALKDKENKLKEKDANELKWLLDLKEKENQLKMAAKQLQLEQKKNDDMGKDFDRLRRGNDQLKGKLEDERAKALALGSERDKADAQLKSLERDRSQNLRQLQLLQRNDKGKQAGQQLDKLKRLMQKQRGESDRLKPQLNELNSKLESTTKENEALKGKLGGLKDRVDELDSLNRQLQSRIRQLQNLLQDKNRIIQSMDKELGDLNDEIKDLQDQLKKLQAAKQAADRELIELKERLNYNQKKLADKDRDLKDKLDKLNQVYSQLDDAYKNIDGLKSDKLKLDLEHGLLKGRFDSLQEKLGDKNKQLQKAQGRLGQLQDRLRGSQSMEFELQRIKMQLADKSAKLQSRSQLSIQEGYQQMDVQLRKQKKQLQKQHKKLKEDYKLALSDNLKSQSEIKTLLSLTKSLQSKLKEKTSISMSAAPQPQVPTNIIQHVHCTYESESCSQSQLDNEDLQSIQTLRVEISNLRMLLERKEIEASRFSEQVMSSKIEITQMQLLFNKALAQRDAKIIKLQGDLQTFSSSPNLLMSQMGHMAVSASNVGMDHVSLSRYNQTIQQLQKQNLQMSIFIKQCLAEKEKFNISINTYLSVIRNLEDQYERIKRLVNDGLRNRKLEIPQNLYEALSKLVNYDGQAIISNLEQHCIKVETDLEKLKEENDKLKKSPKRQNDSDADIQNDLHNIDKVVGNKQEEEYEVEYVEVSEESEEKKKSS